jgi:hypothetical protein
MYPSSRTPVATEGEAMSGYKSLSGEASGNKKFWEELIAYFPFASI